MNALSNAQPDITLLLSQQGIIREVTLSKAFANESVAAWVGQYWGNTVADVGEYKVQQLVNDVRQQRVAGYRQITQRFPSGKELLFEYTTVRLGDKTDGLIAIGKSLQTVAELQTQLITAQQAIERDYWKQREVETRYQLLFDTSNDAVLLLDATNLAVVDANPAAIRALGVVPKGLNLLSKVLPVDVNSFKTMLAQAKERGRSTSTIIHFGQNREPWLVRATLMTSQSEPIYLIQLTATNDTQITQITDIESPSIAPTDLLQKLPDSFILADRKGHIQRANQSFLDMVQVSSEEFVIGQSLARWLTKPGADLTTLLGNVHQHGNAKLFATELESELGVNLSVEISAVTYSDASSAPIIMLLRDVTRRLPPPVANIDSDEISQLLDSINSQVGSKPLRTVMREISTAVERQYIEAALHLANGNRTAAAILLGLSRQSLYAKLNQYDIG